MKNFRLFLFLTFAVLCVGTTACDDKDDAGSTFSPDMLIGTWEFYWTEGWYKDSAVPEDNEQWNEAVDPEEVQFLTFNEDRTGSNGEESFTWKLSGATLKLTFAPEPPESGKILKLTDSELVLEHDEKDGTTEEYRKDTFRRK